MDSGRLGPGPGDELMRRETFRISYLARAAVGAATLAVLMTLTGCGRQCRLAERRVIRPTEGVIAYLATNPGADQLAANGCLDLLEDVRHLPNGADAFRALAEARYGAPPAQCREWREDYRYRCEAPREAGRAPVCRREIYVACGRWELGVSEDAQPEYVHAMRLAEGIDRTYGETQRLCGDALSGNHGLAYLRSRALFHFLVTRVKPEGDRFYAQTCGERS
jgi:hypothetical protein